MRRTLRAALLGSLAPLVAFPAPGPAPVAMAMAVPMKAPAGFLGEYWAQVDPAPATPGIPAGAPTLTQTDAQIDFTDGGAQPAPALNVPWPGTFAPPGADQDHFVVRWTSYVQGPITGTVTFKTVSDDGIQLTVNGQVLISQWIDRSPNFTTPDTATMSMVQGVWYPIEVLYYENGGGAVARLFWNYAGQTTPDEDVGGAFVDQNPPPPAAPTLSISTPVNYTPVINLSWTAVANATSYELRRGPAGGSETAYQTINAPTTSYSDTNVGFNQTYFYTVRAVVNTLTSTDSNEVSGMPQAPPPRTQKIGNRHMCGCDSVSSTSGAAGLFGILLLLAALRRR